MMSCVSDECSCNSESSDDSESSGNSELLEDLDQVGGAKRSLSSDDSDYSSVSLSLTSERESEDDEGASEDEDEEASADDEGASEDEFVHGVERTDEWHELYRLALDIHQPRAAPRRPTNPLAFHQRRVDTLCGTLQSSAWSSPFLFTLRDNPRIELVCDEAPATLSSTCDACHRECTKLAEVKFLPCGRHLQLGHDCIRRVLLFHALHHLAHSRKERLTTLMSLAELPERCRKELARIERLQAWAVTESARPHTWFAQLVAMLEECDLAVSAPVYAITMAEDGTALQMAVGAPATRNALARWLARFRLRDVPWLSESADGWEPLPTLNTLLHLERNRDELVHVGPLQVKCVTRQFVLAEANGSEREPLQLVGSQNYPLPASLVAELRDLERRESQKSRRGRRVRKRR